MAVLLSAAVHEAGHAAVLCLFGGRLLSLRIGLLGAVMKVDTSRLSYGKELLGILAGPGANLLFAVLLSGGRSYVLMGANVVLCLFNLLPLPPLDGGKALELALTWRLGPGRGRQALSGLGTVTALGLAAGLLFLMVHTGGSLWLLPSCLAAARTAVKKSGIFENFL